MSIIQDGTKGAGNTTTLHERAIASDPYDLLPKVPSFVGDALGDAASTAEATGFHIDAWDQAKDVLKPTDYPNLKVLSQQPSAGTQAFA